MIKYTLLSLLLVSTLSHAEIYSSCMDAHGSVFRVKSDTCPEPYAQNHTPEYMYTDRATQRLQMELNALSAQALANIARAGTPLPSSSSSYMNNSQGQDQQQGQSSVNRASSDSVSNSRSNSNAINHNSNINRNDNTATNFNLNGGVFN